ncbi:MAG TPA: serine/threonine-protein kinase, partial [Polyangiaceae bacterium]|nr:serine/threonine-protein kinase [Polyangiaceae bacterium]
MNETVRAEADPLVGTLLAERYRVVALLGSGGMGAVYRAEHVHMKKPVAVKILHRHMTTNQEVVARFEREAVAAGRIEHPNVAAATDFGRLADGSFYLVLEYVEGKSLGLAMDEGPMPPARALGIVRQIAGGLAAAHAAGIVHRDLKPDNVLLVERDGVRDIVKVLDFGIAKVHLEEGSGHRPLTQIGTIFGTPQYMSPEQGQGHTVDARSDLYALGVLAYEMLA